MNRKPRTYLEWLERWNDRTRKARLQAIRDWRPDWKKYGLKPDNVLIAETAYAQARAALKAYREFKR